jgi:hypothetical protein
VIASNGSEQMNEMIIAIALRTPKDSKNKIQAFHNIISIAWSKLCHRADMREFVDFFLPSKSEIITAMRTEQSRAAVMGNGPVQNKNRVENEFWKLTDRAALH